MPNFIISNKQASNMDLAPLRDVTGHILTFRPKGQPGDSKEVDEATCDSEIIERVFKAGWISIKSVSAWEQPPPEPPLPAAAAPPAPPAPPPPLPLAPPAPIHVAPEHSEPVVALEPEHAAEPQK